MVAYRNVVDKLIKYCSWQAKSASSLVRERRTVAFHYSGMCPRVYAVRKSDVLLSALPYEGEVIYRNPEIREREKGERICGLWVFAVGTEVQGEGLSIAREAGDIKRFSFSYRAGDCKRTTVMGT